MGLIEDAVAAQDVISEKFSFETNPDGTGTSEREATCFMGTRTIPRGQRKEISSMSKYIYICTTRIFNSTVRIKLTCYLLFSHYCKSKHFNKKLHSFRGKKKTKQTRFCRNLNSCKIMSLPSLL